MSTLTQRLLTYSYIDRPRIALGGDGGDDAALLVQIDQMMSAAASAFTARDYNTALTHYFACESLIYTHLDSQWEPETGAKLRTQLPRDASLFDPLLSATSQWLNVLAVPAPASPVRPATAPAAAALAAVAPLRGAGLTPVSANPAATAQAMSDLQLAAIYTEQDNTAASTPLAARAKTLDAGVAGALTGATTTAPVVKTEALVPEKPVTATVVVRPIVRLPIAVLAQKQLGVLTGAAGATAVKTVQWPASGSPDIATIKSLLYTPHVAAALPDAMTNATSLWERPLLLPHDYFYTIPLAIAQSYQALGDYAQAETYYLEAAGYQYINTATEGPYVWLALAGLYAQWGDSLYQQGDSAGAAAIYAKVITPGATTAPSTPLYTLAGLATARAIAVALLPQLAALAQNGTGTVAADDVAIAAALLRIYGKLAQIGAGLDFWGHYAAAVPIWTFAYLQQVAINFAQLAQQAEGQVVNYWAQADQARLTKAQLSGQATQAKAQISAAQQQVDAAKAEVTAYNAGLAVAKARATDAAQDAQEYARTNSQVIIVQATGQQVSGGDNGDYNGVSAMASQFLSGQTISGDSETVAAATDLAANRLSQQYQVDSMNRTTTEMQLAATQAQAQLTAAQAQLAAAGANLGVAQLNAATADQTLAVFNADTFTPQVWQQMGNFMLQIYQRYMEMALRAARSMQQAYNFENDVSLSYIQSSYSGVVQGLLGADALMADIQAFTDDLVNSTRGKKQYIKKTISLAGSYGYLFETQLRKTGTMSFETSLDDFDSAYPGSYQGRIQKVLVSVQGIVPPSGISGTLSNGGISTYRLPSDIATPAAPSKIRIQSAETLVISDYDPQQDGVIDSSAGNQTGIFEGAGIAGSWTLSLPPALNDINYGTLTDVVLTILYEARFDPQLVGTVLGQLASRPGFYSRERSIPLAWMYPDLFYQFVATGSLTLTLAAADFPTNQTAPVITAISLLVAMTPGTSAAGIAVVLTAPGKAAVTATTDATGMVSSQTAGSAWAGAVGGSALGPWTLTITAAANPALVQGGALALSALLNLVLVMDYTFTPRA